MRQTVVPAIDLRIEGDIPPPLQCSVADVESLRFALVDIKMVSNQYADCKRGDDMKLYYSQNLNPRVAVAVARHLDAPLEYIRASPRDPAHQDAFRSINPNTLVPVLVEDERTLWETDAIACRLSALTGSDFWRTGDEQPEMIMWISWGTHHLTKAADPIYFDRIVMPMFTEERLSPRLIEKSLRDFREHAQTLDTLLGNREWLVGDRLSYADFRVATALPFADAAELPLGEFPNVMRWHDQLLELNAWRNPFEGLNA